MILESPPAKMTPWKLHPKGRNVCLACPLEDCVDGLTADDPRKEQCPIHSVLHPKREKKTEVENAAG